MVSVNAHLVAHSMSLFISALKTLDDDEENKQSENHLVVVKGTLFLGMVTKRVKKV